MSSRKQNLILKAMPEPTVIPLDKTSQQIKNENLSQVNRLVNRGIPVSEAIQRVTGSYPKFDVDTKINNRKSKRKWISLPIACAIAMSGLGYFAVSHYSPEKIDALSGASSDEDKIAPLEGDKMILVAGTDERGTVATGNEGTNVDVPGIRTDVLSMVSIPKDGSRAIAVSIPRDTLVDKPECQLYNYENSEYLDAQSPAQSNVKVNSIYQEGGAKCLIKTLENQTGVKINGYAEVGFNSFSKVVDSLGGIKVKEDSPIIDDTLGEIISKPGVSTLNGEQALNYVRARKVEGTSKSDFDRIGRQQKFMSSLLTKVRDKGEGRSTEKLGFITDMATKVLPDMKTDGISKEESISIMSSLMNMNGSAIRMTTIPITQDSINSNDLVIDKNKSKDLFDKLINNVPLEGDAPQNDFNSSYNAKQVKLSGKSIIIASHSKYDERAQQLKIRLSRSGARVSIVESQTIPDKSAMKVDSSNKNIAATLAAMYPNLTISNKDFDSSLSGKNGSIIITIGNDYNKAYMYSDSVQLGTQVYIPKDKDVIAGSVVPEKLPVNPGSQNIVKVK